MIGTLARLALLKFLPRRLVPVLTVIEIARFLRSRRRGSAGAPRRSPDR